MQTISSYLDDAWDYNWTKRNTVLRDLMKWNINSLKQKR